MHGSNIKKMKYRSISVKNGHNIVTKYYIRPTLFCYVAQQADVMQNITDAGLVPGKKQNTMGLETSLREIVKYPVSDRTPQATDKFYNP